MRMVVVLVVLAGVALGMCALGKAISQPGESMAQQRLEQAMVQLNGGK